MQWEQAEQCEVHEPEQESERFYHISELAALPAPTFLISGLYVEQTFNLLYGPPKSGKTHLASQVAYDLALGVPHFGRATKQTGTLILAGEGEQAGAQQLFDIPVWACLGSRFDRVTIPAGVIEVQIFADNGEPGQEAAAKARDTFTKAGKRVAIRRPPESFSDWNDALPHWPDRPVGDWEY